MVAMARGRGRRFDRALIVVEALVGAGVVMLVVGKSYGPASTVLFILAGLAVAMTAVFVARLFGALGDETLDIPGKTVDDERELLEHEKQLLLAGLKEFEADAATGKVDREDYEHLRKTAEARAIQIIRTLKEADAHWMARAEALVAERLGRPIATQIATTISATDVATKIAAAVAPAAAPAAATKSIAPMVPPDTIALEHGPGPQTSSATKFIAPASPPDTVASAHAAGPATPGAMKSIPWPPAGSSLFDRRPVSFSPRADGKLACGGCWRENPDDARYCAGCGRPREGAG